MSYNTNKYLCIAMLIAGLLIVGVEVRFGYTQTSLQALQDRIAELEKKLADVRARQEKAHSVQIQLEEQEKKLAGLENYLSESEKYRVQVVEIRMDIKSIHTKIGAIAKEKNDLEENLRLAKNLQAMLHEAQITANKSIEYFTDKPNQWRIRNVQVDNNFDENEHREITSFFISGHQISQDDILNRAYQIYNRTGVSLNVVVHSKSGDIADLDIFLNQRVNMNSKVMLIQMINLNEFKANYFDLTIKNN